MRISVRGYFHGALSLSPLFVRHNCCVMVIAALSNTGPFNPQLVFSMVPSTLCYVVAETF